MCWHNHNEYDRAMRTRSFSKVSEPYQFSLRTLPKMESSKCNTLSASEKIRLLQEIDNGNKKKGEIAKEFGIPASTLSTIFVIR